MRHGRIRYELRRAVGQPVLPTNPSRTDRLTAQGPPLLTHVLRYGKLGTTTIACGLLFATVTASSGQIATDGSLGTAGAMTLTGPDFQIGAHLGQTICNPTNTSCNVFHSFSEFNVNTGQTATFMGPVGIDPGAVNNVLSRVTGGSLSNVNGLLRTSAMPNANFFLMNPNGVVFGPGAQLDVGGSFVVTTANELRLADGQLFASDPATNPGSDALLTTAAPSAFGFLSPAPAGVEVDQSVLEVTPSKAVTVVGGDITVRSGTITAPGGRVNLVAGASPGEVQLDATNIEAASPTDTFTEKADVTLSSQATINVDGDLSGRIEVSGGSLHFNEASTVSAEGQGTIPDGGIELQLSHTLAMTDASSINVGPSGPSGAGGIRIEADQVSMGVTDGEVCASLAAAGQSCIPSILSINSSQGRGGDIQIQASSMSISPGMVWAIHLAPGEGRGGNIDIDLTGSLSLEAGDIFSFSFSDSVEATGHTHIKASDVTLASASRIFVSTLGESEGGRIDIHADSMVVTGLDTQISSLTADSGAGGDIQIQVSDLTVQDTAVISAFADSSGPGGEIKINALEHVLIDSGNVTTSSDGTGPGGNIEIDTPDLIVQNDSFIASITNESSSAPGGDIVFNVEGMLVTHEDALIQAQTRGSGLGGSIAINASTVTLEDGAQLSTGTWGLAQGGQIDIQANGQVTLADNALIVAGDQSVAEGAMAGDIVIESADLELRRGSHIQTQANGPGTGGDIVVIAPHILIRGGEEIEHASIIETIVDSGGQGGDIDLHTVDLEILPGGTIETLAVRPGNGGDIEIHADRILIDAEGGILPAGIMGGSFEEGGTSGSVTISTGRLDLLSGGLIFTGSSTQGDSGHIDITARHIRIDQVVESFFATGLFTRTEGRAAAGVGGAITVTTDTLELANGGQINASSLSQGQAGGVTINAADVWIDGEGSIITTQALARPIRGADLSLTLDLTHPAVVDLTAVLESPTGTRVVLFSELDVRSGLEDVRDVTFNDRGRVTSDRGIAFFTGMFGPSDPFSTFIDEPTNGVWTLEITDGFAPSDGSLEAWSLTVGDLVFDSSDLGQTITDTAVVRSIVLVDAGLGATIETAFESGAGDGGDVVMNVGSLELSHGGAVSASTEGTGSGGNVIITAEDFLAFAGGRVESVSTDLGPAGGVVVLASQGVTLRDHAVIATSGDRSDAGDISITSATSIDVYDSRISTEAGANGGDIKLTAPDRVRIVDSTITGRAGEDGGRIEIDPRFVILQSSVIDGRAEGQPVQVVIDPNASFLNSDSQILTTAASLPPELDLSGGLSSFPIFLMASSQVQLDPGCAVRFAGNLSYFTRQGQGGLPLSIDGWVPVIDLVRFRSGSSSGETRDRPGMAENAPGQAPRDQSPQKRSPSPQRRRAGLPRLGHR